MRFLDPRGRKAFFEAYILEHGVFHHALRLYMDKGAKPMREQVEAIMRDANLEGLGKESSTIPRRAQTVLAWMDWIVGLTKR